MRLLSLSLILTSSLLLATPAQAGWGNWNNPWFVLMFINWWNSLIEANNSGEDSGGNAGGGDNGGGDNGGGDNGGGNNGGGDNGGGNNGGGTPPVRTLSLTWSMPATRENGDLLSPSEVSGYQIYYTLESTGESNVVDVYGANNVNYQILDLQPGLYSLAMTTVDVSGLISELSDSFQVTIN